MTERKRVALLIAVTGLFAVASAQVLVHLPSTASPAAATIAGLLGGGAVALAVAWLGRLLDQVSRASEQRPKPAPLVVNPDDRLAQAAAQAARHRAWLDVILRDMAEGMVLCGPDHRILQHNSAAARLLGHPAPGKPLFALLSREPVLHALEQLRLTGSPDWVSFAGATPDTCRLVQGRMALVRSPDGTPAGYVLTLTDPAREAEQAAQDNLLHRALARELRQPITNLRAAAEVITAYPGMAARERAAFDEVLTEEARLLSVRLETLDTQFRRQVATRWTMADLHSQDLFNCLAREAARSGLILTMVGIPLWLHGDSRALLLALRGLVTGLAEITGRKSFDLEVLLSDHYVTLDVAWVGDPVQSSVIETWLDRPLEGGQSVRDVLDRHNCEPWSQKLANGTTVLRIPLPAPVRQQFLPDEPPLFSRPEFHDSAIMRAHSDTGRLGQRLLSELTFVVFDTETTGLKPSENEIVQLGAVKVEHGRVLTAEGFERVVNPGRPIPIDSIRFHGITDQMVRGKPPLEVVLRQFKDLVGDGVLVGHNAAFDLSFLDAKRDQTGIALTNPVLDTLLLSLVAEPNADPSLTALAGRLGVAVDLNHSALSDAMTTAEIWVRLMELLAQRGIHTLDEAVAAQSALSGGL
ncbi:MAG: PAS domain-containing protein [Rhodospirillaceae bacterium]|nr:PAS domain-containing protein [Rhodospirillales bacterium]